MSIYLDSSALLKRYIDEGDSDDFNALFDSDDSRLTCRITWVEVWRNLGRRLTPSEAQAARAAFKEDWRALAIVEIDELLCQRAASLAGLTGARSLDALHLASISRAGPAGISLVTADLRQAQAARSQGWSVAGV